MEVEKLVQQLKDKIEKELLPIASRMHDLLTADGRGEKDINLEESKRLVQEMNECLVDWRVYLNPTEFNRQAAWIEQWRARIVSLDSRERVAYENRRKQESVLQGAIGGRKSGSIKSKDKDSEKNKLSKFLLSKPFDEITADGFQKNLAIKIANREFDEFHMSQTTAARYIREHVKMRKAAKRTDTPLL